MTSFWIAHNSTHPPGAVKIALDSRASRLPSHQAVPLLQSSIHWSGGRRGVQMHKAPCYLGKRRLTSLAIIQFKCRVSPRLGFFAHTSPQRKIQEDLKKFKSTHLSNRTLNQVYKDLNRSRTTKTNLINVTQLTIDGHHSLISARAKNLTMELLFLPSSSL